MKTSKENDIDRLQHMLDAIQKALKFADAQTRENLSVDEMRLLAMVRLLEIIGEAASRITDERQQQFASIPWDKIIGMRNHLIHGYFNTDFNVIWDTVNNNLHPMIPAIEQMITEIGNDIAED